MCHVLSGVQECTQLQKRNARVSSVVYTDRALNHMSEPFKMAVREHWKRLKRSDPELKSTIKPFVKKKWCDVAYFLSQVRAA